MTPRAVWICALAASIGMAAAYIALALLKLIALFTNVFFFQRWSFEASSPAANHLGWWVVIVPIIGALIIGLMARFGSDKIRGHGIPEAIEAILINGSRVQPKVALLKPLSSAISIGSGGPFGAEGPIIMTGGAFGSMIAQLFRLSSAERKTLLAAGAAAGMSATFAAPVASVLLAVELLLFEWKPRSLIPVALSSVAAGAMRRYLMGLGPLFPVPQHPAFIGPEGLLGCVAAGLLAGVLSALVTQAVYAAEDLFHKLPIHWMWWPALGGLAIGLGGLIFPQALGVGYDIIGTMLQGDAPRNIILGVLLVKSVIWAVSLGSGTSGGVLAPLLMMGGALGGVEAMFLPHEGAGFWPLVSMGAVLGGTMRAPITGVVFAIELTHDINMMLPLLLAVSVSYGFTVLFLKRSILTEKVSRRGYHLSCEYTVDPMEVLSVGEVMRKNVATLPEKAVLADVASRLSSDPERGQLLYPVVDQEKRLRGVITRNRIEEALLDSAERARSLRDLAIEEPMVAYADEPLRMVVHRMAECGRTRFPVVERDGTERLVGMVSLHDLLHARTRVQEEEHRRERVLQLRLPFGAKARAGAEKV
jgi:H+/Cl- antiporter ClcA/CBS domain-containing protein